MDNGFEDRLRRLEEITEKMRDRDVMLKEAMNLFDEGIAISTGLEKELSDFQQKVEKLSNLPPVDGSGNVDIEPF